MNTKTYKFEELGKLESTETMLFIIRASWTHGIYGTPEQQVFNLWVTADGVDELIWPNGTTTTLDTEADDDGFTQQLNDWLVARV